ncbi:MAG: carotenoid biosynthesis protein [Bacteroidales bacterium]|nr:carotenoid biosynthesis protein [Bacteroidales bacterium]
MKFLQNRFQLSLFLLIVIYTVGIVTVLLGNADDLMKLTPFNLLFASGILLYNAEGISRRYIAWFAVIAVSGYVIELIGIITGIIFGEYAYGSGLGLKLFDVPLIIGLNWAILVFATAALVQQFSWPLWLKAAVAATLMVAYDLFLEPVAIHFDFWTWAGGSIPLQNYAAWWLIAFLMLLGTFKFVANLKNRLAAYVIAIQTLFFIILILNQDLSIG